MAQPAAQPSRADPVMTGSAAPANTISGRTAARTAPVTSEPTMIRRMGPRGDPRPMLGTAGAAGRAGGGIVRPFWSGWGGRLGLSLGGGRAARPGGFARCSGEVRDAGRDRDGDEPGGDEVDGGAERRPPAGAGDEAGAVLPHVLEAVAGQAGDDQPGRSGHRGRGDDHEGRRDGRLDGEDVPAAVGDGEADVDRGDQGEPEGVDGPGVQPEEGERGGGLDNAEDDAPRHWGAQAGANGAGWDGGGGAGHEDLRLRRWRFRVWSRGSWGSDLFGPVMSPGVLT